MNPIFRNLISVARRFKLASTLNILGLSVAFTAFIVIMMQLDFDYGFDKFHKNSDKIFRLEMVEKTDVSANMSRPMAERFFESSPQIVVGAICDTEGKEVFFHVEHNGTRNYFKERSLRVSPSFTDVFSFDLVEGDHNALNTPGNVIIPLSLARKLFGNESAVGQQLVNDKGNQIVGAVYRDFPPNSIFYNYVYVPLPEDENQQSWGSWNYHAYLRVNEASNVSQLLDNFKRNFDIQAVLGEQLYNFLDLGATGDYLRLTALPDIHFAQDLPRDTAPKTSNQTLMVLFAIGVVIIVIAAINFTNFNTALAPMRVKSINTQLVLGSRRSTIRLALVFEAVFISFLSYLVALLFVTLFCNSPLAKLVDGDLSLAAHPLIVGGTALVALLTGLFAGLYPSHYMTSFAPALVLKGSFGLSPKGKKLRNTLLGIQYIASFALIIGASFMYLQNSFMQNSSLGYDRETLVTVNIGQIQKSRDVFTNRIKAFPEVDNVTFSAFLLSSNDDGYNRWGVTYRGEPITVQVIPVHYTFLDVMGIKISEGRNFRQEDANTEQGVWVFNESAQKKYNMEVNSRIESYKNSEIIGFMPDIKTASFRKAIEPMGFLVLGGPESRFNNFNIAYIKLKAGTNLKVAMAKINSTLSGFDMDYPFEVRFFDEVLQRLYEKEIALSSLISLFSLMAIFISIVGVFGLVVFDSECKRKEIGIRKVFGASTTAIIFMFNKMYFRILVICFVIAAPLAWYTVTRWLQNFAYKTPMYWWVYLIAFVVVAMITAGTVTFQNWRVASDNPVNSIRND